MQATIRKVQKVHTSPVDTTTPARRSTVPATPSRSTVGDLARGAARVAAVGLQVLTGITVLMTFVTTSLLGPFGVFPALVVGPLFLLSAVCEWLGQAPAPTSEAPNWLAADDLHECLPAWLERLESEADPIRLGEALAPFGAALEAHFDLEEQSGGLFEHLREMDPRAVAPVALLESEHDAIRDLLTATQRCCAEQQGFALSKRRLLRAIRAHQQAEDALFLEVYGLQVPGVNFAA